MRGISNYHSYLTTVGKHDPLPREFWRKLRASLPRRKKKTTFLTDLSCQPARKKKRTLRSNVISPSKDGFSKLFPHVLSSFDNRQSVRVLTLTFHFSSKTVFDWIVTQINNGKNECLTREISNYAELQISTIFVYSGAQRPSSGRRTLFLAVRPTVHTTDSSRKRSFS